MGRVYHKREIEKAKIMSKHLKSAKTLCDNLLENTRTLGIAVLHEIDNHPRSVALGSDDVRGYGPDNVAGRVSDIGPSNGTEIGSDDARGIGSINVAGNGSDDARGNGPSNVAGKGTDITRGNGPSNVVGKGTDIARVNTSDKALGKVSDIASDEVSDIASDISSDTASDKGRDIESDNAPDTARGNGPDNAPDYMPDIGYAPFVREDGYFYIYSSHLASHICALLKGGRGKFFLIEDEASAQNIWARVRVKFDADIVEIARDDSRFEFFCDRLGARHGPVINVIRKFTDFHLLQITPKSGVLVTGFAAAFNVEGRFFNIQGRSVEPGGDKKNEFDDE